MSFGGSQWCRPMSMDIHRSTDHDEDRSIDYSRHRSTSSAESTAECSAVRIMTHEEFAEKHPHPPSPFYVKIDRPLEPAVVRQRETNIDRPPSPPIDRRAPLTYREKELMSRFSQMLGVVYTKPNEESETINTQIEKPDIEDIADSTLKSIDISSCDPTSDGDREITMENFLEFEEFLELEDGEKLGDLDSSREVTMEDFLELEEWLDSQ
ncbi:hypothetical protein F2Q70_00029712 [Brassica cretica]|uniref:Uncharacterized protein n=1 Tax=Brassica cretica TaxID=69181 RepID=A0A8S9FIM3_BRACR|nr:hypothetical protein F2Q70_00029712 [Brassica cretica]